MHCNDALLPAVWCFAEKVTLVVGKLLHYSLLLVIPTLLHSFGASLAGAAGYSISLSILLALVFFVSHNVPENKPNLPGAEDTKRVSVQMLFIRSLCSMLWLTKKDVVLIPADDSSCTQWACL